MPYSILGRKTPYPRNITILDLFARQAAMKSQKVAVRYCGLTLSYGELDRKANALAAMIRRSGVREGQLVPVVIGNSLELPVAWLAVMKAGAAFVPFDPAWPPARIRASLDQIRPPVILAARQSGEMLDMREGLVTVSAAALDSNEPCPKIAPRAPTDLIYGFFTSGSTGEPKCALNCHGGLLNRFVYMTRRFCDCEPKIVLLNSKHVFDSSVWQLLWPLTAGGEVVIPEIAGHLNLASTVDLIERQAVTMTDFVPSVFNVLVEVMASDPAQLAKLSSLRQLLVGGEEINAKAVNKFRTLLPRVRVTNTYGPTEASIGMVFHDITENDGNTIPLGTPIDNTFAVILDANLQAVPDGQTGEIVIGGECLGRGYLGDPEKTRTAFIPNRVPGIPGETLYRTGDLGRIDALGRVHFCGRIDTQVKIAGVRVELAEIEHVLLGHPDIREAVALAIPSGAQGRKELHAFLVLNRDVRTAEIRGYAAARLPEYMLPRALHVRDAMPLTPNGKVDRRALADSLQSARTAWPRMAALEIEDRILEQFRQVLRSENIDADADFLEHGGDSLSAVELALGIGAACGVQLSVSDLYAAPTPRALAALIGRSETGPARAEEPADWTADAELDGGYHICGRPVCAPPKTILVTGATGFIGAHLVAALITRSAARIVLLVRSPNPYAGMNRCRAACRRYELGDIALSNRVSVLCGDLSQDYLGLSVDEWNQLAESVDSIVHCGGMVDLLRDYHHHRPHNVIGTQEVIRLAATSASKHLHYLSTLSVFSTEEDHAYRTTICEHEPPRPDTAPASGYSQSKAIAEILVGKARSAGLPVTVYRVGEAGPSARTGIGNSRSFLTLMLAGCARLGAYPEGIGWFDCAHVDSIAGVIAWAAASGAGRGEVFHLLQPRPVSFDEAMSQVRANNRLNPVSYDEFRRKVELRAVSGAQRALFGRLRAMLPDTSATGLAPALFTNSHRYFARDAFTQLLESHGMAFPEITEDFLARTVLRNVNSARERMAAAQHA